MRLSMLVVSISTLRSVKMVGLLKQAGCGGDDHETRDRGLTICKKSSVFTFMLPKGVQKIGARS